MPIEVLDAVTVQQLRTHIVLTSLTQAVVETVQNSLDAGATALTLSVDVAAGAFVLEDNGHGIASGDFAQLGLRHATSKRRHAAPRAGPPRAVDRPLYGCRGEALASLAALAKVRVRSQRQGSIAYEKVWAFGRVVVVGPASTPLGRSGTVIRVDDLFGQVPVRRRRLAATESLEALHRALEPMLLRWPVALTLVSLAVNEVVLRHPRCRDPGEAFVRLHPNVAAPHELQSFHVAFLDWRLSGFLAVSGYHAPRLRWLFANQYCITRDHPLYRLLDTLHARHLRRDSQLDRGLAVLERRRSGSGLAGHAFASRGGDPTASPPTRWAKRRKYAVKSPSRYAVFYVVIEADAAQVDALEDPTKATVLFDQQSALFDFVRNYFDLLYARLGAALDAAVLHGIFTPLDDAAIEAVGDDAVYQYTRAQRRSHDVGIPSSEPDELSLDAETDGLAETGTEILGDLDIDVDVATADDVPTLASATAAIEGGPAAVSLMDQRGVPRSWTWSSASMQSSRRSLSATDVGRAASAAASSVPSGPGGQVLPLSCRALAMPADDPRRPRRLAAAAPSSRAPLVMTNQMLRRRSSRPIPLLAPSFASPPSVSSSALAWASSPPVSRTELVAPMDHPDRMERPTLRMLGPYARRDRLTLARHGSDPALPPRLPATPSTPSQQNAVPDLPTAMAADPRHPPANPSSTSSASPPLTAASGAVAQLDAMDAFGKWPRSAARPSSFPAVAAAASRATPSVSRTTADVQLTKADVQRLVVLGQLDAKFLLGVIPGRLSHGATAPQHRMLVAIDQHAADEAIRFTALLAAIKRTPAPATVALLPPMRLPLPLREVQLLARYRAPFRRWGLHVDAVLPRATRPSASDGASSTPTPTPCPSSTQKHSQSPGPGPSLSLSPRSCAADPLRGGPGVVFTAIPTLIADRCALDPLLLADMTRQYLAFLEDNGGVPGTTPPESMIDLLRSIACRSAVMFGTSLTPTEQRALVGNLGRCGFPFQCAHGRPSLVPLLVLPAVLPERRPLRSPSPSLSAHASSAPPLSAMSDAMLRSVNWDRIR
ncbi:hypothetical protein CXG81DRAFT_19356 [Caulochytrium protostelioides]|uniref:MutL C-terminal dimerisation domain-containing protein n=1 Tax=Caulochytrium protostelioides TaxID=1555241 RepID=A0A4V1IUJ1_9FUNG|nr:hypothetical protein CXG81DRAFT_19356 [Caulochytrium protostelioides]|eukprot:RKP00739.1 hypothetical protein CXG81DRAFT_19356 [Caulochytrium protostelioides]